MKKTIAALLAAAALTGCAERPVDRPDLPQQTQTAQTARQAQADKQDVSRLSREKTGFGCGVQKDEKTVPRELWISTADTAVSMRQQ